MKGLLSLAKQGTSDLDYFLDPDTGKLIESVEPKIIGCSDLDSNGTDEMVAAYQYAGIGAALRIPWVIYRAQKDRWRAEMVRNMNISALDSAKIQGDSVLVNEPTYGPHDANCCASGLRKGSVQFVDGEFSYLSEEGDPGRAITLSTDGKELASIGSFDVQYGDISDAIKSFGTPSRLFRNAESCPAEWQDVGLSIAFYDLGGANPCRKGVVSSARVFEGGGWYGPRRLEPGMPKREMFRQFPLSDAYRSSESLSPGERGWVLKKMHTYIGQEGMIPLVVGYTRGNVVFSLQYFAYVGGD